jgi:hypothetical protein
LIIGDHVEALQLAMQLKGERIVFPDIIRKRGISKEVKEHAGYQYRDSNL